MENFLKDMPAPGELLSMAIQAVLVLAIGFIIMKLLLKVLKEGLKRSKLDESLHSFIITCAKVFMWILIIITILGALDVPIATFVAVLGAAGAAIALALKDSLGNVAGGVLILGHAPLKR
ncbi:MAG: mechanosensitive ion channel [Clostridiales bacterium]|nr:mechanosensitive ion channel [Clostridiales bacterium]